MRISLLECFGMFGSKQNRSQTLHRLIASKYLILLMLLAWIAVASNHLYFNWIFFGIHRPKLIWFTFKFFHVSSRHINTAKEETKTRLNLFSTFYFGLQTSSTKRWIFIYTNWREYVASSSWMISFFRRQKAREIHLWFFFLFL